MVTPMPDSTFPDFLSVAEKFQLGILDTERSHPKTAQLSHLADSDISAAVELLKDVDRDALAILGEKMSLLPSLANAIRETLDSGDRIFLCGCGATGRLSISLGIFARRGLLKGATTENVFAFMAGGDAALIRSIERFEDRPEFGERQLSELGFRDGDLLIASTEGGETPFVIGCTEMAARESRRSPFFLYCNPDEVLRENVERSRLVIDNPEIHKINLAVGPMALSGSTRMQASTVLMAAIGFAMKHAADPDAMAADFEKWRAAAIDAVDWSFLADFIEAESGLYRDGGYVLYEPGEFGITVLTDTTERSPTFTLTPFEREGENERPSLCWLHIENTESATEAWRDLLNREPRPLDWGELKHITGSEAMQKFDFSDRGEARRRARIGDAVQKKFRICKDGGVRMEFAGLEHTVPESEPMDELGKNLLLKMLLNAHSTLVMGRLGRYEDNLMTYVSANNFKLIDRAVRYTRLLMDRYHGGAPDYDVVVRALLAERECLEPDEPIVLKTIEALKKAGPTPAVR